MTAPLLGDQVVRINPAGRSATTAWVGMVVFLASWTMMFAGLFFAYGLLRIKEPIWPPAGYHSLPLLLPGINTAVLLLSSLTLHLGVKQSRSGGRLLPWLTATLALGLAFVALQAVVWQSLWAEGFVTASGTYGAIFYTLTTFHALHIIVGLGLLLWLVPRTLQATTHDWNHTPVRMTAMFWHFVDVVWIILFLLVYVL